MKKTLIALAAVAATSAAFAQSNVTLYGTMDLILHKDKNKSTELTSGGVGESHFGLKGSEDLGGGLKANFKLEQGFTADDGKTSVSGTAFSRQSWLGLSGNFGEVQLGSMWSAYDDVFAGFGAFDASVLAPMKVLKSGSPTTRYYDDLASNGIKYISPEFAGFTAAISHEMDETKDAAKTAVNSLNVQYATGPFAVALGYQDNKAAAASDFTLLTGSYDLGVAKLMAAYEQQKPNDNSAKTTSYNLAVDYPVSANLTLSAAYGSYKVKGATGSRPSGYSVAFAYGLSKRTTVYGGAWSANNAAKADDVVGSRYGFGIRHAF